MNLSNIQEKVSRCKNAVVGGIVGTATVLVPTVSALAAEGDSSIMSAMTSGFTSVQTGFDGSVDISGPIAMGIFVTFTLWRLGLRFFKTATSRI